MGLSVVSRTLGPGDSTATVERTSALVPMVSLSMPTSKEPSSARRQIEDHVAGVAGCAGQGLYIGVVLANGQADRDVGEGLAGDGVLGAGAVGGFAIARDVGGALEQDLVQARDVKEASRDADAVGGAVVDTQVIAHEVFLVFDGGG